MCPFSSAGMSFKAQPTSKSGHRSDAHGFTPEAARDKREADRRSNPPTTNCQLCKHFKELGRTTEQQKPSGEQGWAQIKQTKNFLRHNLNFVGCDKGVMATFDMVPATSEDRSKKAFVMKPGARKRGRPSKEMQQSKKVRFTLMCVRKDWRVARLPCTTCLTRSLLL